MKIYVVQAYIDLYEELFAKRDFRSPRADYNDMNVIENLNPKVDFCVKEYDVLEEHEEYYIRKNDNYYSRMTTHKKFDNNFEYDYEDEILNYPHFTDFNTRNISVIVPTTEDGIENAKEIIAKEIERKFKIEMLRMQKMIGAAFTEKQWNQFEAHYEWDEWEEDVGDE